MLENIKSKPILFNTAMVQAILDGRKTVTRRDPFHFLMKPGYNPDWSGYSLGEYFTGHIETGVCLYSRGAHDVWGIRSNVVKPKYQVGDILWVREKFNNTETTSILYAADREFTGLGCKEVDGYMFMESEVRWRPSIHMPREAARIFLKVTGVRVERLQDITLEGCISEGITDDYNATSEKHHEALAERAYPVIFGELWDSTIKKKDLDEFGWDANPFVCVVEFERCENAI